MSGTVGTGSCHPAAVPPDLAPAAPAPPLDEVVAAINVLADPTLPGRPWTVAQIAAVLPILAEGPSALSVEAWGARWLAAVDEGELTDEAA